MKILLQFKDPDHAVALDDKWLDEFGEHGVPKKYRAAIAKCVEWGEYIQVEYDTETKEWRVVPVAS